MGSNWPLTQVFYGGEPLAPFQAETDDPRLVESVRRGDAAAISRAFDLCMPALRHVALKRFGLSTDDVDDVLQEVRVVFWRGATRFRGESSLRTFLIQITCNKCVDHLRRQQHHVSEPLESEEVADPRDDPVETAVDRLALAEAFDQLSPRQRQLLELCYVQGKGYREIAQELGIVIGTVGSIKAEALAKLRSALSNGTLRRSL